MAALKDRFPAPDLDGRGTCERAGPDGFRRMATPVERSLGGVSGRSGLLHQDESSGRLSCSASRRAPVPAAHTLPERRM